MVSDTFEIQVPEMNPHDTIALSVLATSQSELPPAPVVSVRGSGISGVKASSSDSTGLFGENSILLISAIVAAYSGLAFVVVIRRRGFSSLSVGGLTIPLPFGSSHVVSGKHRDDQNLVMAYLCGSHGLLADVEEYLRRPCDTSYWSEADRFAAIAVANPTSEESEKRKSALKDLVKYANVATLSEGIIYYNIARIALAQGNQNEVREYLTKAQKSAGDLIQTRLELEPDLQRLLISQDDKQSRPTTA
jgi:hypothetical protein